MANANIGLNFYISEIAAPTDLDLTGFEDIVDWLPVANVGNIGETGSQVNILSYPTMGSKVSLKSKGITNAGDPTLEVSYMSTDPGQIALRAAAQTRFNYAFKIEYDDKLTSSGTGTIEYNRGLVAGPVTPHGGVEDFILNIFTLALNQEQITVPAT